MAVTEEIINGETWIVTTFPNGGESRWLKPQPVVVDESAPEKMTALAFMDLVGDTNMVTLLNLAKTDPIAELLVKKIDRADVIDFGDADRGPKRGLDYLLSTGLLSQSEYDRIMRREFLT